MSERGFESLKVWQKSHQLMLDIHHELLPLLPKEERYGLNDQIRRSSKSIGANIAEGYGRFYYGDNVRFCYNARGSLDETLNHVRSAFDLNYCPEELYQKYRREIDEIRKMLNGYIDWLKRQKTGAKEPGANLYLRELQHDYLVEDPESE
jgi:four helix bundle protein